MYLFSITTNIHILIKMNDQIDVPYRPMDKTLFSSINNEISSHARKYLLNHIYI